MRNFVTAVIITICSSKVFASTKIIAEVFSYPFQPISVAVTHYRFLESGEGQSVIVRPDGTEESPVVLTQLAPDRITALLNSIELVRNAPLVPNAGKESSTCKPNNGLAEYHIYNKKGEKLVIAKREYCRWFDVDQIASTLIELTLDGLPPISYLRN